MRGLEKIYGDDQTDTQTDTHTDTHFNTMNRPGLRAGPIEKEKKLSVRAYITLRLTALDSKTV